MSQVVLNATRSDQRNLVGARLLLIATAAASFSLVLLSTGDYEPLLIVAAFAGVVLTIWAIPYVLTHTEWLPFVLELMFFAISFSWLSERERGLLHYGLLIALCLPLIKRFYASRLPLKYDFKLYSWYFAWAAVTVVYSLAPTFSAGRLIGSILGFVAAVVCVDSLREPRDVQRLFARLLTACALITAVTVIAGLVLPRSITWQTPADSLDPTALMHLSEQTTVLTGMDRFRGLFGNANDVGALMLATVSTALICWKWASKHRRFFLALLMVAATGLAAVADSRSPFVALAAGGVLYLLWRYRWRGLLVIALASAAAVGALYFFGGAGSYLARGNVDTLTGRTDIWAYVIEKIRERPLFGYGYEVSGAIFGSRYFPLWYGPWNEGPHSSLHNGYLAHMIGVGLPATLFWLFIILRPWVFLLWQKDDPWNLKSAALLIIVPLLIYNLTESALSDFSGESGFLFSLTWAVAERYRIVAMARDARLRANQAWPAAVRALRGWPAMQIGLGG